jgi:hypothetical protein
LPTGDGGTLYTVADALAYTLTLLKDRGLRKSALWFGEDLRYS